MSSPDALSVQLRAVTLLLFVAGLAFVALGVYYIVTPASSLPSFFPGHLAGSSRHHVKHGLAAFALAAVAWIGAWFSTAPSRHGG